MFYSPYFTSYHPSPSPSPYRQYSPYSRVLAEKRAIEEERARSLARQAHQRARRAQYLFDEEDDSDSDEYGYTLLSPREGQYLEARKVKADMDARRREENILRRLETQRRQQLERGQSEQTLQSMPALEEGVQRTRSSSRSPHSTQRVPPEASQLPRAETCPPSSSKAPTSPDISLVRERYSTVEEAAVARIQTAFRAYRSLRTIRELERQFDDLKGSFQFPAALDFQGGDKTITLPSSESITATGAEHAPKLAYTSRNYDLHLYVESLNQLLVGLDGVNSWGEAGVRNTRRNIVKRIEAEASSVEEYWKQLWAAHVSGKGEEDMTIKSIPENEDTEQAEVESMVVDPNPTPLPGQQCNLDQGTLTPHQTPSQDDSIPESIPKLIPDDTDERWDDSDSDSIYYEAEEPRTPVADDIELLGGNTVNGATGLQDKSKNFEFDDLNTFVAIQ